MDTQELTSRLEAEKAAGQSLHQLIQKRRDELRDLERQKDESEKTAEALRWLIARENQ